MKVSILAAVSLDGYIARTHLDGKIDWTSAKDKDWLHKKTQQAGYVIMGHNTYKSMSKPLTNRINIVYTHNPKQQQIEPRTEYTNDSPEKVLNELAQRGAKEVIIFGGEQIFRLFLAAGLVKIMWLTIAPAILRNGIKFPYSVIAGDTTLLSSRELDKGELLLELRING